MEDLFFFEHTKLSANDIRDIFGRAPNAPETSAHSAKLAGKRLDIAIDDGGTLRFEFSPDSAFVGVTGTLDGALDFQTEYALLELNDIALLAFRIPATTDVWIVAVDLAARLATVVAARFASEIEFAGARVPAREAHRIIYTGEITGGERVPRRHKPTKRLTGKAVLWEYGAEKLLTIYATHMWSSFIPYGSAQTFTAPSDYYELDGRHYLYSRVEAEFSGALVLEVFDLYTMRLIGARVGVDENDRLEFKLYNAKGAVIGQFAAYNLFGKYEYKPFEFPIPKDAPPPPKGFRMVYRAFEMTHPMTLDEVNALAAASPKWEGAFAGEGKNEKMMPYTDLLNNKKFALRFDGGKSYKFETLGSFETRLLAAGENSWRTERYEAFEVDDRLVMMTHTLTNKYPMEIFIYAIDLQNGLATCLRSILDNERRPREPRQEWMFGVIEFDGDGASAPNITAPAERHCFTKELVGRSFTWTYNDNMVSQHIYSTPESYSWSIIMDGREPGPMWSSPCKYVKIRDGVYMMSWIESRSAGTQGTYVFNTKTMHDCGVCFGITHDQMFEYNTFGAESRGAGSIDLSGIYGA